MFESEPDVDLETIAKRRPHARITIRAITEFGVATSAELVRRFDGFYDLGIVFCALLRATGNCAPPGSPASEGAISVNALADALQRPFETVRRQVLLLRDAGWCAVTSKGVTIPPNLPRSGEVQALLDAIHDRMVRLVDDLNLVGFPMPGALPEARPELRAAIREAGIEILLASTEVAGPYHDGWMRTLIYGAVMTANARRITFDPELSQRYSEADTPPPDALRYPVRGTAIADALHLPHATVRRHVNQRIADGAMVRVPGGILISHASLQAPLNQQVSGMLNGRLLTQLRLLHSRGFPFDRIETAYVGIRPDPVDFGRSKGLGGIR